MSPRREKGLVCANCGEVISSQSRRTVVVDTRQHIGSVRRRRQCPSCKTRVTTFEIVIEGQASERLELIFKLAIAGDQTFKAIEAMFAALEAVPSSEVASLKAEIAALREQVSGWDDVEG